MGDAYYYIPAAEHRGFGFSFDESPVRLPHREMRDKARGDPSSDLYLMFAQPGAVHPTPPGTKLVRVPKPGLGVKPARADLLQQLEAFSCLSTNHLLACTDAISLLGNRLTQRVRFIILMCEEVRGLKLTSLTGLVKDGTILTVSYKSFLFYLNSRRSVKKLCDLLPEEPFDEEGEFVEEGDEDEEVVEGDEEEAVFLDQEEAATDLVAASNVLAEALEMSDSSELVGRLFSLLPLQDDQNSKVLFAHILLLLAERDVLASADTSLQPKELRLRMFQFFNSSAKADRDTESAHIFSSLFPLGFRPTDTFKTKEISLKTDLPLSTSYISTRQAVLDNLKDGLRGVSAFPPSCIPFKALLSLSLSYIEGGVALLDRVLAERKNKKRRRQD